MGCKALDEDESEDVEDEDEHCEAPKQGNKRAQQRVEHEAQRSEETHHSQDAKDLRHLEDAQGAHEGDLDGSRISQEEHHDLVVDRENDQDEIEDVPAHFLIHEEIAAVHHKLQGQFQYVEDQETRIHVAYQRRRILVQVRNFFVCGVDREHGVQEDHRCGEPVEPLAQHNPGKTASAGWLLQLHPPIRHIDCVPVEHLLPFSYSGCLVVDLILHIQDLILHIQRPTTRASASKLCRLVSLRLRAPLPG
mmetsp:Transcript_107149/g.228810  ORF Transcript_107149/g.228810 Transcript_107149/m.228810 type:complete len:249 (-) Transcript_107149:714-1460(-)